MKTTPLLVAILAAAAVLSPVAAYADDPPPPLTYIQYLDPVLDCKTATWDYETIHYQQDWIGPGADEYSEVYESHRTHEYGPATGTAEGDCPNWKIVEDKDGDPKWVGGPVKTAPAKPAVALPAVVAVVRGKVGLAVPPKVL